MTSQSRPHAPVSARGTATQGSGGSKVPAGKTAPSWPGKGRATVHRRQHWRKRAPTHPDCTTDRHPHRAYTRDWLRQGLTKAEVRHLVRTRHPDCPVAARALAVFCAMSTVPEGEPITAAFPITGRDLAPTTKAGSVLAHIED